MTQHNLGNAYLDRIRGNKAENIELAIAAYTQSLEVYNPTDFTVDWAMTQNSLGNAYHNRIRGDIAENIEIAIAAYTQALKVRTHIDFPVDWAMTQHNLGNAYCNRIRGDIAENIEIAIAAYTQALEARTRTGFPVEWAATQNSLGNAYLDRIREDKAENIESAITAFNQSLKVFTRTNLPVHWSGTQNNLGLAYRNRIRGNKAENIEFAIAAFNQSLEVRTYTDFAIDWAKTQNSLGFAYLERIRGNIAENIEFAIAACSQALKVFTRTNLPRDWAATQYNLGAAYNDRITGDKAENLENSIAAYTQALEVFTRTDFPLDWAVTQNNLGNAYYARIRGNKAENIEFAIAAYTQALEVRTRTDFPVDWAMTQHNLGTAYNNIIKGDIAENLESAIAAYTQALTVFTRIKLPINWAATQYSLGAAYNNRIKGDKAENLENSIAAYTQALTVFTRIDFPVDWAMTQHNLGITYSNRIRGNKAENIEFAIAAFTQALEVRTRTDFPQDHADTLLELGILYQQSQQLNLAYDTFKSAIFTVEDLQEEIISGEESKRKQAERYNPLYIKMVEVCLELGKKTEAITYIERSKTRNLVEQILNRDLKTIFPGKVATQLEQLRDEIASGQYQLQNGKAENANSLREHLQQLRTQRQQLQDKYLPIGSSFEFAALENIVDNNTGIIEWYITSDKILAVVIQPGGTEITIWKSSSQDREALFSWMGEYINDYYEQKEEWQNQLEKRLQNLAVILHLEEILDQISQQCQKLILIPHQFLHLLPLHALLVENSYLIDLFPQGVGYTPSCQLLQQAQLRQRDNFQSLFAIQNPTGDLFYADLEVESIQHYFMTDPTKVLRGENATRKALDTIKANLESVNCLHFSCHGSFNLENANNSCLILHGANRHQKFDINQCLTLSDLFNKDFNLNQCRLVVLSACETGMIEIDNDSDEYIGLPSGFLYAGSSSVVSSLWTVDQVSTAFLFIKFYENLQNYPELRQGDIAFALNQTITWLRNMTSEEGEQVLQRIQPYIDVMFQGKKEIIKTSFLRGARRTIQSHLYPFANPFHWAAFTAIGY